MSNREINRQANILTMRYLGAYLLTAVSIGLVIDLYNYLN